MANVYFTGKPCKYGHIEGRYVSSNGCIGCAKEHVAKHKETRAAHEKIRRNQNKERYNTYSKRFREQDKEKRAESDRQYYERNKAHIIEKMLHYYNTNKEECLDRMKLWQENNPNKVRDAHTKSNIHRKQAIPPWEINERQQIREMYNLRDMLTIETGINHEVDHIVPIRGKRVCGLHTLANLRVVTAKVNSKKGNKLVDQLIYSTGSNTNESK